MEIYPRSETTRIIIESVACPYCKALAGENCVMPTVDGFRTQPMVMVHDERKQEAMHKPNQCIASELRLYPPHHRNYAPEDVMIVKTDSGRVLGYRVHDDSMS